MPVSLSSNNSHRFEFPHVRQHWPMADKVITGGLSWNLSDDLAWQCTGDWERECGEVWQNLGVALYQIGDQFAVCSF